MDDETLKRSIANRQECDILKEGLRRCDDCIDSREKEDGLVSIGVGLFSFQIDKKIVLKLLSSEKEKLESEIEKLDKEYKVL